MFVWWEKYKRKWEERNFLIDNYVFIKWETSNGWGINLRFIYHFLSLFLFYSHTWRENFLHGSHQFFFLFSLYNQIRENNYWPDFIYLPRAPRISQGQRLHIGAGVKDSPNQKNKRKLQNHFIFSPIFFLLFWSNWTKWNIK